MKVYISGKIGEEVISDETRAKFAAAAKTLRQRMLRVFDPTTPEWVRRLKAEKEHVERFLGNGEISFYEYCLLKDIEKVSRCDAIYMLADWRQSPGARAEYAFASAVGKQFFFEDRFQACEYLCQEMHSLVAKGNPPAEYLENDNTNDAEIAYAKKHLYRVWRPISIGYKNLSLKVR